MDEDALNRCRAAQEVVVCVLAVPVGKRQRGMQKAAAARAYGEGGQQQRGRGVRGYQEAAPERVSAVASLLGGRRGGLTMWARAWTWAYRAKAAPTRGAGGHEHVLEPLEWGAHEGVRVRLRRGLLLVRECLRPGDWWGTSLPLQALQEGGPG